jgi:hypothetical protein
MRKLGSTAALVALLALATPTLAQAPAAVDRAHNFLKTAKRGRDVLSYVHFGYTYQGHTYVGQTGVKGAGGKLIPGQFALHYDYKWGTDGGQTRVVFLCNPRGDVYEVQTGRTNAGPLNQPFDLATLSIRVVGNVLLAALGGDLTMDEKRDVQRLIDNANAKGMLQFSLAAQQRLGR